MEEVGKLVSWSFNTTLKIINADPFSKVIITFILHITSLDLDLIFLSLSVGSHIRHYWQNGGMAPTIPQTQSQDEGVRSYDSDLFFPFFGWVGWKEC